MQKKENAKIREEIEFYERIIQEKGNDDEDEEVDVDRMDTASQAYGGMQSKIGNKRDISALHNNNQRSQLNTRGTNRSQSNANVIGGITQPGQGAPLVYIPRQKTESEEDRIKRYERVIEKLKKMLDHERKLLKNSRVQYQREMQSKTELEHLLRETVEQVRSEKRN